MKNLQIGQRVTPRNTQSIDNYLRDIAHFPLLTLAEEGYLPQRIKEGDNEALNRMVEGNLRFVVSVAKNYQNLGLDLADLISVGNLGLITAAKRFDPTMGFKFCSYAVWWIRQSILQSIAKDGRTVALPANQQALLSKIVKETARLEQQLGRTPTREEVADSLEANEEHIRWIEMAADKPISLDAPLQTDEDTARIDTVENTSVPPTDATLMQESLCEEVQRVISDLPQNECMIVKMSFGIGQSRSYSLEEIALKTNLTRERVRQIRAKAIERLRRNSRKERLRVYLT